VGAAVVVFCHPVGADSRLWHTRIALALGILGPGAVTWLVLANFATLIGGSARLALPFEAVVVFCFAAGTLSAVPRWRLSRRWR
jgi:hypothetical protein